MYKMHKFFFAKITLFFFDSLFYLKKTRLLFYLYAKIRLDKIRVVAFYVNFRIKKTFKSCWSTIGLIMANMTRLSVARCAIY